MQALASHLLTQAFNNAWANHRLLGACMQLTEAEYLAPRTGFFPSIQATLNHLCAVDHYYVDALERSLRSRPANPAFDEFFGPAANHVTCADLRPAQGAVDRRLIALCEMLDATALARQVAVPRSTGLTREPMPRLLAHLFQHQVHHRGQAHAMLSGTRVAPPQLDDFFCANDAPLRVADFKALGFTEEMVWPA
jgi:uncharacterized damage-inducible protein DinB